MPLRPVRLAIALVLMFAIAGCGGPGSATPVPGASQASAPSASPGANQASVIPVIVSSQQVVGRNRFVFSFLDPKTNLPAAAPDRTAAVAFIAPGGTQPGTATKAAFVWAIEGSRGDYVANVEFGVAGDWKAVFITNAPGKPQEAIGVGFQVQPEGVTIAIGARAPASNTPTAADVGGDLAKLADVHCLQIVVRERHMRRLPPGGILSELPAGCGRGGALAYSMVMKPRAATAPALERTPT